MKRIKPEDLPKILSKEDINVLAEMASEIPQSEEWHKIFEQLSQENFRIIMDRKIELQKEREKAKREKMTEEEKMLEAAKWKIIKNDTNPHEFYGNMGQPETPQEFKNRYGVWPPGYDKDGNKIFTDGEQN